MSTLPERIEIVLLMAKFNSPNQVIRQLKKKKWRLSQIPLRTTIYAIHTKFRETGSKSVDANHWIQRNHKKSSHISRKTRLRLSEKVLKQ